MRSSPEPLFTPVFFALVGFLGAASLALSDRIAAEAAQVPALARLLAEPIGALVAVVLFVGVFCAGAGGLVS